MRSYTLRDSGTVRIFTSSTANAVPLPLKGKDNTLPKMRFGFHYQARFLTLRERERPERGVKARIAGGITSSTAERSPFPYEGKDLTPLNRSARPGRARCGNAPLAAIWNDPPQLCYLVSGLWSLFRTVFFYSKEVPPQPTGFQP